jgi:hypothetical protein
MKKTSIILTIIGIIITQSVKSQIQTPVHWAFGTKKISVDTYQIHLKATIDDGWHLYSQKQPKDAIPIPTKIIFKKDGSFELVGKAKEVGKMEYYLNPDLGVGDNQYSGTVDFVQEVKVKTKPPLTIACTVTFQTCTNKMCLPAADQDFTIPIK